MFKIFVFLALFAMAYASSDISQLFDSFLKDTIDNHQLADGSLQTTYFNIPHRSAPRLIEPFYFGTHATSAQIAVSNVRRLRPVEKEVRRQQVWDDEDYDYNVMATAISMDIKVTNLTGDLYNLVGDIKKGEYLLNGNLSNLVMNVTMQLEYEEYLVLTERDVIPTTLDMTVTGDEIELITVESRAAQIVGDLVTSLFSTAFRSAGSAAAGKALEKGVHDLLSH